MKSYFKWWYKLQQRRRIERKILKRLPIYRGDGTKFHWIIEFYKRPNRAISCDSPKLINYGLGNCVLRIEDRTCELFPNYYYDVRKNRFIEYFTGEKIPWEQTYDK